MASELSYRHTGTGQDLYAVIRSRAGDTVWQTTTSTFVTMVAGNWGNYDIPLTETPTGGYVYVADFPAVTYGVYGIEIYVQAGASPALDDVLAWSGQCYWSGASLRRRWGYAPAYGGG